MCSVKFRTINVGTPTTYLQLTGDYPEIADPAGSVAATRWGYDMTKTAAERISSIRTMRVRCVCLLWSDFWISLLNQAMFGSHIHFTGTHPNSTRHSPGEQRTAIKLAYSLCLPHTQTIPLHCRKLALFFTKKKIPTSSPLCHQQRTTKQTPIPPSNPPSPRSNQRNPPSIHPLKPTSTSQNQKSPTPSLHHTQQWQIPPPRPQASSPAPPKAAK